MTNPDPKQCICQGSGWYMVATVPTFPKKWYLGEDISVDSMPEFISTKMECEYHGYNMKSYSDQYLNQTASAYNTYGESTRKKPPVPKIQFIGPIKYPDGWPDEQLEKWCEDKGVPFPEYLKPDYASTLDRVTKYYAGELFF